MRALEFALNPRPFSSPMSDLQCVHRFCAHVKPWVKQTIRRSIISSTHVSRKEWLAEQGRIVRGLDASPTQLDCRTVVRGLGLGDCRWFVVRHFHSGSRGMGAEMLRGPMETAHAPRCWQSPAGSGKQVDGRADAARIADVIQGAYATFADPLQTSPKFHIGQDEFQKGSSFVALERPSPFRVLFCNTFTVWKRTSVR